MTCPEQVTPQIEKVDYCLPGPGQKWGDAVKGYGVSFRADDNVLKLWRWLHSSVNTLKNAELYTL